MDVIRTLRGLYEEKRRLDAIITGLEARLKARPAPVSRPGRKRMSAEERLAVSARMRQYWQNRRQAEQMNGNSAAAGPETNANGASAAGG